MGTGETLLGAHRPRRVGTPRRLIRTAAASGGKPAWRSILTGEGPGGGPPLSLTNAPGNPYGGETSKGTRIGNTSPTRRGPTVLLFSCIPNRMKRQRDSSLVAGQRLPKPLARVRIPAIALGPDVRCGISHRKFTSRFLPADRLISTFRSASGDIRFPVVSVKTDSQGIPYLRGCVSSPHD